MPRRYPRRIATISVHTSPLEQPGTGDAGGLNVYVVEVAKRMAARGVEVDIFTRAVTRDAPPVAELVPGVLVRHVPAGPFEDLDKSDLPAQLCHFTFEVLRTEAAYAPGRYDLVHGHYWLSGHVGAVAKERWGVPLVQSMHTLGRVKNAALAHGDAAEPTGRLRGEADVVAAADRLVANTDEEARQLAGLYGADPAKIWTVNPGVDLSVFRPGPAGQARRRLGLPADGHVIVFAGRVQPLKAPDVALRAAAVLVRDNPALARSLTVAFIGGPSGTGRADPDQLTELANALGAYAPPGADFADGAVLAAALNRWNEDWVTAARRLSTNASRVTRRSDTSQPRRRRMCISLSIAKGTPDLGAAAPFVTIVRHSALRCIVRRGRMGNITAGPRLWQENSCTSPGFPVSACSLPLPRSSG